MALAHAILVALLDQPQTGYDLGKRFQKTVGHFWKSSHQQIYQELHRMEEAGWLESETVDQTDRPTRIVYALTRSGRDALHAWAAQPTYAPSIREELVVKLFALGHLDPASLLSEVGRRREDHRDRLRRYEAMMAEHYPDPARLPQRKRGRYLGLRMGILNEQAMLQWCDEALGMLQETITRRRP